MISHPHRCIFVHIPKCGGQSVETMFLRDLGLTWEQRAPLLMRQAAPGEPAPPMVAHLLAQDYVRSCYISQELFDSYLKFAVIRDPYARVASIYRFLKIDRLMTFHQYLTGYLTAAVTDSSHRMHWFVRPQVDFLFDEGGLMVDRVIRLEHLDDELPGVARELGLADCRVPRVNVSERATLIDSARMLRRTLTDFGVRPRSIGRHEVRWTPEGRALVRDLYDSDFARLGFDPGS